MTARVKFPEEEEVIAEARRLNITRSKWVGIAISEKLARLRAEGST